MRLGAAAVPMIHEREAEEAETLDHDDFGNTVAHFLQNGHQADIKRAPQDELNARQRVDGTWWLPPHMMCQSTARQ